MLKARSMMDAREADRETSPRGTSPSQIGRRVDACATPAMREAVLRIESEYREMPGLSLTLRQAVRLWGLDHHTCELVLANLIERRILKRAANGTFILR
jgi:hypothetical protein